MIANSAYNLLLAIAILIGFGILLGLITVLFERRDRKNKEKEND